METALIACALAASVLILWRQVGIASRIDRLERKIGLVLEHLGIDYGVKLSEQVKELARQGQKIQAIKLLREETGIGLAEAKEAVENWMETGR